MPIPLIEGARSDVGFEAGVGDEVKAARRYRRRPERRDADGQAVSIGQLVGGKTGEAKVAKLDRAVLSVEDVGRFDIAMKEPATMRVGEHFGGGDT